MMQEKNSLDLKTLCQQRILLFDGAFGTMLQARGLPPGGVPEEYNITHPDVVREIHREYVQAGADFITANTFQANRFKVHGSYSSAELIEAGVRLAWEAGAPYVALDMGPTGQLLEPMGTLSFDEAYEAYKEIVIAGRDASCVLIETISDLYEAKAAILAVKENSDLPVFCTMTFQEDGRSFVGCDPKTMTLSLQALGVDALGMNCSLGPDELLPLLDDVLRYAKVPVMVQSNAGLPDLIDGQTVYHIEAEQFAEAEFEMVRRGVKIVGGCCGTTPACIQKLREKTEGFVPVTTKPRTVTAVCSGSQTVILDDGVAAIGERLNPTGKKKLKAALQKGDMDLIAAEAIDQSEAGAQILDVNVGLPDIDESAMMKRVVREVQAVSPLPLQIDSSDVRALETGLRYANGKPLLNSVNGKAESMAEIFPLAKRYGAALVALALDEDGIPETAEGRLAVARKIVATAATYGIGKEDIVVDCLVLTASAQQEQVHETLRAVSLVRRELGVRTVLGVSNVSFGLPQREIVNATFLAAAFGAGLDAAIVNPLSQRYREVFDAYRVLSNEDLGAAHYIACYGGETQTITAEPTSESTLYDIIIQGRKGESAPKVRALLEADTALSIINQFFIPALDEVGKRFENGTIFLPQLMQSAEAVQNGFAVIKEEMEKTGEKGPSRGKILLATVHGDIHDIGKNIVRMLLENYGFEVYDLGKDVPAEEVLECARKNDIHLIGLSALMTTTVKSMKETIALVKESLPDRKFIVGGAVLNEEYAEFVGAEHYAKDALDTVALATEFFQNEKKS